MAGRADITPEMLRQLLRYEPETGKLFWRERDSSWFQSGMWLAAEQAKRWNTLYSGLEAFTSFTKKGYAQSTVLNCLFRAHRVAWALYYGEWPKQDIDHINGNPADNRVCNLRDVSNKENHKNIKLTARNTSGVQGVCWDKGKKKWMARLGNTHLGRFANIEDATTAVEFAKIHHGYHQNHGAGR